MLLGDGGGIDTSGGKRLSSSGLGGLDFDFGLDEKVRGFACDGCGMLVTEQGCCSF